MSKEGIAIDARFEFQQRKLPPELPAMIDVREIEAQVEHIRTYGFLMKR